MKVFTGKIQYQFIHRGSSVRMDGGLYVVRSPIGQLKWSRSNTVFCDVGNDNVPGIIDHHRLSNNPECATSLFSGEPEKYFQPIDFAAAKITIVTHHSPDLDALAACYLVSSVLSTGNLPTGAEALASYVLAADLGKQNSCWEQPVTLASLVLALHLTLGGKDSDELRDLNVLMAAFPLFEKVLRMCRKGQRVDDVDLERDLPGHDDLKRLIWHDALTYERDLADRSRMGSLVLQNYETVLVHPVPFLTTFRPRSFLWKHWARCDTRSAVDARGFVATCAFLETFVGQGRTRAIVSVNALHPFWLRGLGILLDHLEIHALLRGGADEQALIAEPRPGFHRADPWFDGRGASFNFSIVDAPIAGSVLGESEILEGVENTKTWQRLGENMDFYATRFDRVTNLIPG